jgi:co-chaperonin GroES (HSP10)
LSDYKVEDRRGTKTNQEDQREAFAPPVSLFEEIEDVRVTEEQCFVHPGAGRVVVQEDSAMSKVGRIILPDKTKRRPTTVIILKVGKNVSDYEVRDRIIYGLYSGTVLTFKGWDPKTRINFRILSEEEILAKLDMETPELEGVGT